MSPAIGETLNAYFHLEDFRMIRSVGAYRDILRRSHLFGLCPFLQTALRIVDLVKDEILRSIQQGMDKGFHGFESCVQIQRADECLEQRSQQPISLATA